LVDVISLLAFASQHLTKTPYFEGNPLTQKMAIETMCARVRGALFTKLDCWWMSCILCHVMSCHVYVMFLSCSQFVAQFHPCPVGGLCMWRRWPDEQHVQFQLFSDQFVGGLRPDVRGLHVELGGRAGRKSSSSSAQPQPSLPAAAAAADVERVVGGQRGWPEARLRAVAVLSRAVPQRLVDRWFRAADRGSCSRRIGQSAATIERVGSAAGTRRLSPTRHSLAPSRQNFPV